MTKNKTQITTVLACLFMIFSVSAKNEKDTPRNEELDEDTRKALKEAMMPLGMQPEDWERSLLMYKIMMRENDDFEFYGQVLDHNKRPIPEAEITFEITAYDSGFILRAANWGSETKTFSWTGKTDRRGCFMIEGRGIYIEIKNINKGGYIANRLGKTFIVSRKRQGYREDLFSKNNPATFTVWPVEMMAEANNISQIYHRDRFIADGSTRQMDLISGDIINSNTFAGIIYSLKSEAQPNMAGGAQYDWTFKMSSSGGGVIETTRESMFIAPTNGYLEDISVEYRANQPLWRSGDDKLLYIKSGDGKTYGVLFLGIHAYFDGNALISVRGIINTNGSPVLLTTEAL